MYEFKDEYLTGIEQIDREHRRLFDIAEETYQLKCNEFIPDKYDQIKDLLEELSDYTRMHFKHEEEYMESIQYKRMFTQKTQHAAFIKWLDELDMDQINDEGEEHDKIIDDILNFLTNWLVGHILETDKQIAED